MPRGGLDGEPSKGGGGGKQKAWGKSGARLTPYQGLKICKLFNTPKSWYLTLITVCHKYVVVNLVYVDGRYVYKYMDDLLKLDSCRAVKTFILTVRCCKVTTPLRAAVWQQQLHNHPDQRFGEYILKGIRTGFRLGFQYG